jgi:hypothetical protein
MSSSHRSQNQLQNNELGEEHWVLLSNGISEGGKESIKHILIKNPGVLGSVYAVLFVR